MIQWRTTLVAILAWAFSSLAVHADPGTLTQKVDAVVDRAIADGRIVGAVVLVAHDGKPFYQRAAGFADREARRPMQLDTQFRLSSVSKPIVTVAALELVERQQLSLDDPVSKWLPDFRPKLADGRAPAITVRQLLTHTSGLGYKFAENADGPYHQAQVSDGFDDIRIDLAEEVRRLGAVPLHNAPGKEWRYSLSIDVLGAVIERVTKKPLGTAVANLVTRPLGMKSTGFVVDRAHAGRVATAYMNTASGAEPMAEPQPVSFGPMTLVYSPSRAFDAKAFPSAGAGMIGSAPDLMKLLGAMLAGGAPVLEKASVEEMFRNQIEGIPGFDPGMGFGFGGGLVVDPATAKSPQSPGTMFWGGVYGHSWFVDPAKKLIVIAFTNTAQEGMAGPFPDGLRDAVYEGIQ